MDIIQGRTATTITTGKMDDSKVDYITKNNHIKHQVVYNKKSTNYLHKIGDDLVYIYADPADFKSLRKGIHVGILFVTNTMKNAPEDLLPTVSPDIVVLDSNLKPWIREKWLSMPNSGIAIKVHDIKSQGAYSSMCTNRCN